MSIKQQLYDLCVKNIDQKISSLQQEIQAIQNDAQEETKSSAGDKYETGKAMMQIEMEKLSSQLNEFRNARNILGQIDPAKSSTLIQLGSIVITSHQNYFLSVSAGMFQVDDQTFYCISPASPIGALLIGKKRGDQVTFRQQQIAIQTIL